MITLYESVPSDYHAISISLLLTRRALRKEITTLDTYEMIGIAKVVFRHFSASVPNP